MISSLSTSLGTSLGRRLYNTLGALKPAAGATQQCTRVGRGPGSGRGKTSGRGQKGQKARGKVKPHFEGGQTPITKLFPKVGFKSRIPKPAVVNLGTIQTLIDARRLDPLKPISPYELMLSGCINPSARRGIKILGRGSALLRQPITLSASKASQSALAAIEAQGGQYTAQFYTQPCMDVLLNPQKAYSKFCRIPLRARPINRRTIEYYRNPEKNGYLVDSPNAPQILAMETQAEAKSPLVVSLEKLRVNDASQGGARTAFR